MPRDIDPELRARLAAGGFVVLVGDSAAGKSRSAFEAMAATLSDHVLIAPTRGGLAAALEKAAQTARCVLWLNDLEGFAGEGGLSREGVARLLSGERHHRVIVATLRAVGEERLIAGSVGGEDAGGWGGRAARELLEQAHRIRLLRRFSDAELDAAQAHRWDWRIADALAHADEYGIAEYMTAGPELLHEWENGWDVGGHPRGAALVAAAIECRRAVLLGGTAADAG